MTEQLWYRHPVRVWSRGQVVQYHGRKVELRDVESGEMVTLAMKDANSGEDLVHAVDMSHMEDLPDLATMNNLHQAPLLDLLRRRYMKDDIYTFTGDILISINPYRDVEGLYDLPEGDNEHGASG